MGFVYSFTGIGTHWNITFKKEIPNDQYLFLCKNIQNMVAEYEKKYSRFIPDSLLKTWSKKPDTYTIPDDIAQMIDLYALTYTLTQGSVSPLVGKILENAGYDEHYSFIPSQDKGMLSSWENILEYSPPYIKILCPCSLDFGAFGKGNLIDRVYMFLIRQNLEQFVIDAGRDIRCHNTTHDSPLRVGLASPFKEGEAIGIATISSGSICGSSGLLRSWGNMHHIVDARSGKSPKHIAGVFVYASTALLADAVSTCLFFIPADTLQKHFEFEYLIIYHNGSAEFSKKMPIELF